MVQNLAGMGFTVVFFGPGFRDNAQPTKELMKLTLEEKLAQGGQSGWRCLMDHIEILPGPAGSSKLCGENPAKKSTVLL